MCYILAVLVMRFIFSSYNFELSYFMFVIAKQKIDSGFFLHEAELKIKKEKKDKKAEHFLGTAKVSGLGDMFLDMNPDVINSSSSCDNSSDEDFVTHHKKKRM